MLYLSFLVPYRNRDLMRVKRCIESLQKQSVDNHEIILVDYGSDEPIKHDIKKLCEQFPNVKHHYYDTRKMFWSRSQALNLAAQHASGEYLCMVDIDLIYTPQFVAILQQKLSPNTFWQYKAYLIPENFNEKDYHTLTFAPQYPFAITKTDTGAGLIVVPAKTFQEIGGFDEYFCVWGVEDMDLKNRLLQKGLTAHLLDLPEAVNFHQWHTTAAGNAQMPLSWLSVMEKYAEQQHKNIVRHNEKWRVALSERIIFDETIAPQKFSFQYPYLQAYQQFYHIFQTLPSGAMLSVTQSFEAVQANKTSKLAKYVLKINQLLARFKVSYRLTELKYYDTELPNFRMVRDFLFFFVVENRPHISDYSWHTENENYLSVGIIKK